MFNQRKSTLVKVAPRVKRPTNRLAEAMSNRSNETRTANGAKAFKSTKSYVLDLFAKGGSARRASESELITLVSEAFGESPELAARAVFYLGDVRGGQGFRDIFKAGLEYMVQRYPRETANVLRDIPEFTRWDMMYQFVGTSLERNAFQVIKEVAFAADRAGESHLVFKWLKTKASNPRTNYLARLTAKYFGMTEKEYRKFVVRNRKRLSLVETALSSKQTYKVNYSALPSKAALKYREAFKRHDAVRYNAFLQAVIKGEAKMNMSVGYPHEILSKYRDGRGWSMTIKPYDASLEAAWLSLPDYMRGDNMNSLTITDVSGSMLSKVAENSEVTAMDVSIALAIYTAEHNKGFFRNKFMTFSNRPALIELSENDTLKVKIEKTQRAPWQMNTDIDAAFRFILNTAVQNRLSQDEMPATIFVVSDMQFDSCSNLRNTNFETWQNEFNRAGYDLPGIMFWQVTTQAQVPVKALDNGAAVISGFSPSVLKFVFDGCITTPYDFMLEVLMTERYDRIGEAFA